MVNLAIANIGLNKGLSTVKSNLGKFFVFLGLISFQGVASVFTYAGLMAVLIASIKGGDSSLYTTEALWYSIATAIFVESMVLVFHLLEKHNEAKWILIAVSGVGLLKMVSLVFPAGLVLNLNTIILSLVIIILSGITPFGVYHLCKSMAEDTQLKAVFDSGIALEKAILKAEDSEDKIYVSKKELRAKTKDAALRQKYANQN